jgi:hypothetical protein
MVLSPRLPLSGLIELCRCLRRYLGAGLSLRDVFRQRAEKGAAVRRPGKRLAADATDAWHHPPGLDQAAAEVARVVREVGVHAAPVGTGQG